MKTLKRIMLVALAVMALTMTGMTKAQAAAKKPGEVTHLGETKVTSSSISFRFNKAKRAKEYEVRVYEAVRQKKIPKKKLAEFPEDNDKPWSRYPVKATKKLVRKMKTKKTKCIIRGLSENEVYAIKVRAINENKRGKWTTQFMKTVLDEKERINVQLPGTTTAEGKYLEQQYKNWKKYMAEKNDFTARNMNVDFGLGCVKKENVYRAEDPNNYAKEDLLRCYKRGYWTDVEGYQIMKNIMDDYGIPCRIVRNITWDYDYTTGKMVYNTEKKIDRRGYLLMDLKNNGILNIGVKSCSYWEDFKPEDYCDLNPNGITP